jgi:RES domain-containing protein
MSQYDIASAFKEFDKINKLMSPIQRTMDLINKPYLDLSKTADIISAQYKTIDKALSPHQQIMSLADISHFDVLAKTINDAMLPYQRAIDSINSIKISIPSFFQFEDIYTDAYQKIYQTIEEDEGIRMTAELPPEVCVFNKKSNSSYNLVNQKDIIGISQLFTKIKIEDAKDFFNFISEFPLLGYKHKVGEQIFSELEAIPLDSLELLSNAILYRGRLWEKDQTIDYPIPEIWNPPFGTPVAGRFNTHGISYLYMSDSAQTVVSELKGEGKYTVMSARLTKDVYVLDISQSTCYIFELCNKQKTGNTANPKEYLVPNYIAQCCAYIEIYSDKKINGIKYKSSLFDGGECYVFFNLHKDSFRDKMIVN